MQNMVESRSPWVGSVPCGWSYKPIKRLLLARDGGAWGNEPENEENGTICLRIADFDYDKGVFKDTPVDDLTKREYSELQINRLQLSKGDVLIEKSGGGEKTPVGRTVIYDKEYVALFANFMDRLRFDTSVVSPFYAEYWLRAWYGCKSSPFYINQTIGIQNINLSFMLSKECMYYPSLDEQACIISFLDTKCAEIDALSADIQSEIDTLEAYKRSVITEAVTKGLDKNVPMKNSGIEWVGEIPATWDVHPVYVYFGERKNKNYALQEQNLLSLSYGKIIRKDIDTVGGLLPASFNTYNIVEAGDIIIRPTDLQNDKRSLRTGLVTEKGIITSAYIDLAPKGDINSAYFHYLLHSFDVQKVFYNMGNGVRQGLNYSEFSKLMVFAPPRNEQDAIVAYLDDKCAEIEAIIAQKQEQLAILADYKKSVIYEYVTGKKEVPVA